MTKTNVISILMIAFLAISLSSCKTRTTNSALRHGEVLKTNLNSFDKNREKLSTKLVASLETAGEALMQENPDIPEVSRDFEKEWRSIMNRYDKLKSDFDNIGKSSSAYFEELNTLSGNINNDQLRAEELAKNKALEAKWQKTFVEADKAIAKVTTVLESGNDFHMVLVASSIRQKLEQNVTDLKNIAEQAKLLLGDLEVFSQAGRELVEGRG